MKISKLLEQDPDLTATNAANQAKLQQAQQQAAVNHARLSQMPQKLNLEQLKQLLPGIDVARMMAGLQAEKTGRIQNANLIDFGRTFQALLQADPNTTTKVMNLLKKAQQMPIVQTKQPSAIHEGIMDYARGLKGAVQGATQGFQQGQGAWNKVKGAVSQGLGQAQSKYTQSQVAATNQKIAQQVYANYQQAKKIITKKYRGIDSDPDDLTADIALDLKLFLLKSLKLNPRYDVRSAKSISSTSKSPTVINQAKALVKILSGTYLDNIIVNDVKGNSKELAQLIPQLVTSSNTIKTLAYSQNRNTRTAYNEPEEPQPQQPAKPNVDISNIRPATQPGAPTPDEQAKLQQRIQQAMGQQ